MTNKEDFKIVDSVPYNSEIWNIGKHAPDGYVALCYAGGESGCEVIGQPMIIKSENAKIIMQSSHVYYMDVKKNIKMLEENKLSLEEIEIVKNWINAIKTLPNWENLK